MSWTTVTGVTKAGAQLYRRYISFAGHAESSMIVVYYEEALGEDKVILQSPHSSYILREPLFSAWLNGQTGATPIQGIESVLSQPDPQAYADGVIAAMGG